MSRLNEGLYSSQDQTWMTPPSIIDPLLAFLGRDRFDLDVCCSEENIPAIRYFKGHEVDSLKQDWHVQVGSLHPICWMNPPYGDILKFFLKKAYEESLRGCKIWALIPARTETVYQHEYGLTRANFTVFIYQRISFIPSESLREQLITKWIEKNGDKYPLIEDKTLLRPMAEKAVDNGTAPFPTMLLYFGHDHAEILARWVKNPPLLGTAMVRAEGVA